MPFLKELEYNEDIDKVIGVQFSVLSPEEICTKHNLSLEFFSPIASVSIAILLANFIFFGISP